jgi:DNA polymerase IV
MPLRILFLDMNSFFASVEQQFRPELRARPVAVAAVDVGSTCCIAVSQEAKALGIRRGMPVWQAKQCPSLTVVEARPALYVQVHHALIAAVDSCLPVQSVESIDELFCRLAPRQAEPAAALELARQVKQTIYDRVGGCLRCSIGLAPNRLLAKVASNMRKPDGLVVIEDHELPQVLYPLRLDDLPGIGQGMLSRLHAAGVTTVQQLCQLTESRMKKLWGGVVGQRWWHWLRGHDLGEPPTHRSTVGNSHVLPPDLRTQEGARGVLLRLIHKAAARLRRINYWAGRMEVYVSFTFREAGWSGSIGLGLCQDTLTMIEAFDDLWRWRPQGDRPTQVAVTLYNLVPDSSVSLPLFPAEQQRRDLSRAIDQLNDKFGAGTVYFGGIHRLRESAPTRISFNQIPDFLDD